MYKVLVSVVIVFVIFLFSYEKLNKEEKVINIGFLGGLSGKYSNLGHSLLEGMSLAFEEENYMIDDKKINIISKDDKQKKIFAKLAMEEFEKENIKLILGSGTSSMTKIALDYTKGDYKPIVFSASASSSEFSKKDDNFFRTQVSQNVESFEKLSKYLIKKNKTNIYTVYDSKNSSYSKAYVENFENSFIANKGKSFMAKKTFTKDFSDILEDIKNRKNIDVIVIVANTIDTAKLVQLLKLNGVKKTIVGSSWSKSDKLLEDGGKYVEDMIFLTSYDSSSTNKRYLDFVNKYKQKFNMTPSVFSSQAYEATKIIIEVLKENSDLENFKQTLLKIKKFQGLQGEIEFDSYGDIKREYHLMKIKDKAYQIIGTEK